MADLVNHPGMWLEADAAASLARWEAVHGALPLSDAGRSEAEQLELLARWERGGTYNRPPYLYKPGWPSPHQSGLALDTPAYNRFESNDAASYGWRRNISSDPVHFIYEAARDQHQSEPAGNIAHVIDRIEKRMTVAISTPSGTAILVFPGGEYAVSGEEGKEVDAVSGKDRNVGGVIDAVWGKRVPLNQTDVNTVMSLNQRMTAVMRQALRK